VTGERPAVAWPLVGPVVAWGYPDQPSFTPLLARLSTEVAEHDLVVLRVWSILAVAGLVLLAVQFARLLGGGRDAQVLTAVTVAASAVVMTLGHRLSTATFDTLAWTAVLVLVTQAFVDDRPRLWLVAGVVAGVGLDNKHAVAFLLLGILAALVLLVVTALLLVTGGKGYYLAGAILPSLAAGCTWLAMRWSGRRLVLAGAGLAVSAMVAWPALVPVLGPAAGDGSPRGGGRLRRPVRRLLRLPAGRHLDRRGGRRQRGSGWAGVGVRRAGPRLAVRLGPARALLRLSVGCHSLFRPLRLGSCGMSSSPVSGSLKPTWTSSEVLCLWACA
jgi:hypothetical protein